MNKCLKTQFMQPKTRVSDQVHHKQKKKKITRYYWCKLTKMPQFRMNTDMLHLTTTKPTRLIIFNFH